MNREPLDIGDSGKSNPSRISPDALAARLIFLKRPQPAWGIPIHDEAVRQNVVPRLVSA